MKITPIAVVAIASTFAHAAADQRRLGLTEKDKKSTDNGTDLTGMVSPTAGPPPEALSPTKITTPIVAPAGASTTPETMALPTGDTPAATATTSSKEVVADPMRGLNCGTGAGTWLCNDYQSVGYTDNLENEENDYKFNWNIYGVPDGVELFNELDDELDKNVEKDLILIEHSRDDKDFIEALRAIQRDGYPLRHRLGPQLFGDLGYSNPGWGGITDFDIYKVKKSTDDDSDGENRKTGDRVDPRKKDMKKDNASDDQKEEDGIELVSFGQFYRKDDPTFTSDDSGTVSGSAACEAKDEEESEKEKCDKVDSIKNVRVWGSLEEMKDMTVGEAKNRVFQECQFYGKGLTKEQYSHFTFTPRDQAIKCKFKPKTIILVGLPSWRATKGALQNIIYSEKLIGNGGMKCDDADDSDNWDHPQKRLDDNVHHYVIAMDEAIYDMEDCTVCDIKLERKMKDVFKTENCNKFGELGD